MKPKTSNYAKKMQEEVKKLITIGQKYNYEQFTKDDMVSDAILRKMEVIGECAKHIPEDLRKTVPEIPYKGMVLTRNYIAHDLFSIQRNKIWSDMLFTMPKILPALEKLIEHAVKIERHHDYIKDLAQAPDIKNLPRTAKPPTIYKAYAKEVIRETGNIWTDKTNQIITGKLLLSSMALPRIKEILQHSPDPITNPYKYIRQVSQLPEIKTAQKAKAMER